MIFLSKFTCRTRLISTLLSLNKMPLLQSNTLLALSWLCLQCSHSNDSTKNKKCCSSCQAWRDGLAPLSAKGGTSEAAASDVGLVNDDATCLDKNGPPNNASPRRGGSLTKSRGKTKRKCGGGGGGVAGSGVGKGSEGGVVSGGGSGRGGGHNVGGDCGSGGHGYGRGGDGGGNGGGKGGGESGRGGSRGRGCATKAAVATLLWQHCSVTVTVMVARSVGRGCSGGKRGGERCIGSGRGRGHGDNGVR
jgi:hypothetical protein